MTNDKEMKIEAGLATNGKTLGELFGSNEELKPCKVKKLLNDEIVTGMLNPDGSFTDIEVVGIPEYEIPSDDKVGTKILDEVAAIKLGTEEKTIWVKDVPEEKFISTALPVYKRVWSSEQIYFRVGYVDNRGSVVLDMPKFQDTADTRKQDKVAYEKDLLYEGYTKTVQKYSPVWYRDTNLLNDKSNMKVSFVPSNDVYEIINSNKNESIGYVSHEGNVIYWNQYRY